MTPVAEPPGTPISATLPTVPAALAIIRAEHRALRRLFEAMTSLLTLARHGNREPDFNVLRAMLFYVDEFPERLHHVKETKMLFARMRELSPTNCALLDRLDGEHAHGERRIRELEHKLSAWQFLGDARRAGFERSLAAYIAFYLEHMRVEEVELLPAAQLALGEDDWRILARAFGLNRDALAGAEPEAQYAALFDTLLRAIGAAEAGGAEPRCKPG